jgi:hypothetical protein
MNLFSEIKERKVLEWVASYIGAAWLTVQVFDILAPNFNWSAHAQEYLLYFLAGGIPLVSILAWFRGSKGSRKISSKEILLLGIFLVLLGVGFKFISEHLGQSRDSEILDSARLRILEVAPPQAQPLSRSDLEKGIAVSVVVEQFYEEKEIDAYDSGYIDACKPMVNLMVFEEGQLEEGDSFTIRAIDSQRSTFGTQRVVLSGTLNTAHVQGDEIILLVNISLFLSEEEVTETCGDTEDWSQKTATIRFRVEQ